MQQKRIDSLQVLRAFACLAVLFLHCDVGGDGAFGVSIFIVLSGFVLIYTYYPKKDFMVNNIRDTIRFAIGKIKKLYPLHIITMLAVIGYDMLLVIIKRSGNPLGVVKDKGIEILLNVFLLQSWVPSRKVYFSMNGVAWYLSVCLFLYILFPYILRYIKKYTKNEQAILNSIIVGILLFSVAYISKIVNLEVDGGFVTWLTYICPLFRLGDFFIGCNIGYLYLKYKDIEMDRRKATFVELALLVIIFVVKYLDNKGTTFLSEEWMKNNLLFLPISAALVYLFAMNRGWVSKILTRKALINLGNLSPYIFLIHTAAIPYLRLFFNIVFGHLPKRWIFTIVTFVFSIIASYLYLFLRGVLKKRFSR